MGQFRTTQIWFELFVKEDDRVSLVGFHWSLRIWIPNAFVNIWKGKISFQWIKHWHGSFWKIHANSKSMLIIIYSFRELDKTMLQCMMLYVDALPMYPSYSSFDLDKSFNLADFGSCHVHCCWFFYLLLSWWIRSYNKQTNIILFWLLACSVAQLYVLYFQK